MYNISLDAVKQAPISNSSVGLFATAKNEMYFLPHFMAHYRELGVDSFVFYDDGSTDGSFEYLMKQADCTVVRGNHGFGDPFGLDTNGVARRYTEALREIAPTHFYPTQWALVMDLDEFLVLPEGFNDLPSYCRYLDRQGQTCGWGSLIDTYRLTLNQRNYSWSQSPLEGEFYFDCGPYVVWKGETFPDMTGRGIRLRLLGRLRNQYPEQIDAIYGGRLIAAQPNKVPLIKHGSDVRRIGIHFTNVVPSGPGDCAMLHFKFTPATDAKIAHALDTGCYSMGSLEYRFLKFAIDNIGDENLIGPQSCRYIGARSLSEAGLMKSITTAGFGHADAQRLQQVGSPA